ncbi:MAG: hypothetical protein ACTSQK_05685 [Candidatus Heimdallarchaeota archaeon]
MMKPISLCLIQMGKSGLEIVKSYPQVLPDVTLNELTYKSMPMGAKPGDFTSTTIKDVAFSSLIFEIPSTTERNNIGSIVAIFNSAEYNIGGVKKVFSIVVNELQDKRLLQMDTLMGILPELYNGFQKGQFSVEISSIAKIEFKFTDESQDDEVSVTKRAKNVSNDIWR